MGWRYHKRKQPIYFYYAITRPDDKGVVCSGCYGNTDANTGDNAGNNTGDNARNNTGDNAGNNARDIIIAPRNFPGGFLIALFIPLSSLSF